MKTLVSMISFFCLLSFANCQSETTLSNDSAVSALQFEEFVHDFGTIEYKADGTFAFKFEVVGEAPVTITNVRSTCGCTVPSWPKQPFMPGESGEITVKYDTKRVGSFRKTITVYSNASNANIPLSIKGSVKPAEAAAN